MSRPRSFLVSIAVGLVLAPIAAATPAATPSARPAATPAARPARPARPAPATTVLTVGGPATGRPIPPGFLGLSLEYSAIPAYAGTNPSAIDPVFVQLIRNLAGRQSAGDQNRRGHDRPDVVAGPRYAHPGRRERDAHPGLDRNHQGPRRRDRGATDAGDQLRSRQRDRRRIRGGPARRGPRTQPDRGARAGQRTRAVRDVHLGSLGQAGTPARLRLRRVQPGLHADRPRAAARAAGRAGLRRAALARGRRAFPRRPPGRQGGHAPPLPAAALLRPKGPAEVPDDPESHVLALVPRARRQRRRGGQGVPCPAHTGPDRRDEHDRMRHRPGRRRVVRLGPVGARRGVQHGPGRGRRHQHRELPGRDVPAVQAQPSGRALACPRRARVLRVADVREGRAAGVSAPDRLTDAARSPAGPGLGDARSRPHDPGGGHQRGRRRARRPHPSARGHENRDARAAHGTEPPGPEQRDPRGAELRHEHHDGPAQPARTAHPGRTRSHPREASTRSRCRPRPPRC